jgi:hypothetical protein
MEKISLTIWQFFGFAISPTIYSVHKQPLDERDHGLFEQLFRVVRKIIKTPQLEWAVYGLRFKPGT